MYSKNFRNGEDWDNTSLSEKETQKVLEELRTKNLSIMQTCIDDAKELMRRRNSTVATALFSKLAEASYTVLQNELQKKVQKIRDETNGKWKPLEERISEEEFAVLLKDEKLKKVNGKWLIRVD